jgi:hypothetical protein
MSKITRLGMHYFPDTTHFREEDINRWIPRLEQMGVSWLTIIAPHVRAVPERFINALLSSNITPILHFQFQAGLPVDQGALQLLFQHYARWGVQYITLFDRPNCRTHWYPATWSQVDLVERFLDLFIPLAELAISEGLIPIFPPLEPGGDYWDLAFLQTAMKSIKRRGNKRLLDKLVLGVYAWANGKSVLWGKGGPEVWQGARPYYTPEGQQDHLGFHIFDWYQSVAWSEIEREIPVMILRAGASIGRSKPKQINIEGLDHTDINMEIARLMEIEGNGAKKEEYRVPPFVLACNFWLLASEADFPYAPQAWYQQDDEKLPVVDAFKRYASIEKIIHTDVQASSQLEEKSEVDQSVQPNSEEEANVKETVDHSISHYVLLPLYAWGAADWDIDLIQPLIQDTHPTIGFSLSEARLAEKVTVVGGEGAIPDEALDLLRKSGCFVERIHEDGTLIAT